MKKNIEGLNKFITKGMNFTSVNKELIIKTTSKYMYSIADGYTNRFTDLQFINSIYFEEILLVKAEQWLHSFQLSVYKSISSCHLYAVLSNPHYQVSIIHWWYKLFFCLTMKLLEKEKNKSQNLKRNIDELNKLSTN